MKQIVLALLVALAAPSFAAAPQTAPKWDYWYTYSVHGEPWHYYNDKVETKNGKIHFENHLWKKEEGFINEEHAGVFSADDAELTPLFFNFRSTYRSTETVIDGSVDSSTKMLTVKARKVVAGKPQEIPTVKRGISPRVFFSVLFPVWIGHQLSTLKQGVPRDFTTVMEDNLELGFSNVTGSITLDKPDAIATKTGTQKLKVDYRGVRSFWWVEKSGATVRIEYPDQSGLVERVTPAQAKKFLD